MTLFRRIVQRLKPAASAGRVSTPSILQMEAVECGAASLAMVLAHFGKFVPLEELRVACGVSRDGSKAGNLVRAARQYGLAARGFKAEPAGARRLAFPLIAFWNFNHFLVVDGFADGKVYLNDPAMGRRVVSDAEFDLGFTGVVMAFEKGPEFTATGRPPSLIASLRRRLVGAKAALAYLVLVGILLVIPGLVIPVFTAVFIDTVLVANLQSWLRPLVAGMLGTGVVLAGLTWLQKYYLLKLETRIALATSARFFWHVLRLPIGFYHQRSAGDISSRVGINNQVANILSEDLAGALLSVLTAVFFAAVMLFYDVTMSLITIFVVGLNFAVLRYVAQRRKELNQKLAIDHSKVMGTSMNGLMLIESLKASGAESDFFSRWAGYQARLMSSMQEMSRSSIALDLLPKFLTAVNATLVLGIGGARVMSGDMSIGMLVAFQALVISFVGPVNALVALGGKIQSFQGDMNRLDDVLRYPCEELPEQADVALAAAKLSGALELKNITFGYSKLDAPLLSGFSLTLQAGKRVALVGASGCGKSTIAKLVAGLYQPWEGEIAFDGKARGALPRRQLLNSVATVDQDIALFAGTVRDNLTMWDPSVPDAVMVAAAKDACIHDVISARPGGYDSVVAEGGGNFSGGQRQRLEIARALSANPRLLVLDEATSALDPLTEKNVDANLRRRACSCLIVAHRLSAIRDCDEIIFLEKGKVIERGTHEALMQLNGHYARLIANE
ncbi:NHLP family bacteriocin export ABC transporter peptidase/permease/ATPase subunit [Janthinobacterium fluminis]|uniref:NHLP family bacteriocin export ABC transporter peptidase/permease/ATPase subunit n=1 Tax=Janthinobacterium fluminis TaxID=2987524 RepID=A0ABT5K0D3_9BURK|nr:NHLP family bacteriocin export ABC transporter peptidase/permease/ATPase subunit [Janthinobacterium fluminis]MDC8758309.1 NHLP family bacteriocin export ABC transporter peptidase/permease/ATPase subunit [Janthinobacterium fluminis]